MDINLEEFAKARTPEMNQILFYSVIYNSPQNIEDADAIRKAAAIVDRSLLSPPEVLVLETIVNSLTCDSTTDRTLISPYIEKFGLIIYQYKPYFMERFFSDVNSGKIILELPALLFIDEQNKSILINDIKLEYSEFFQSDIAVKNEISVEHFFDFYCQMASKDKPFINPYLRDKLSDEFIDEFCRRFELDRDDLEMIWRTDLSGVYDRHWRKNYREISSGRDRQANPEQNHADMREAHDRAVVEWVNARERKAIEILKKRWKEEFEAYRPIDSVEANSKSVVGRIFRKLFRKK